MTFDGESVDGRRWLRRLADMSVGRLVFTIQALPAVLPVRFHLDRDRNVVLRAPDEGVLAQALDGTVVALEAGEIDPVDGSGWTVTVVGRAGVAAGPRTRSPGHWRVVPEPGSGRPPGELVIRIRPDLVSGRTLAPTPGGTPPTRP